MLGFGISRCSLAVVPGHCTVSGGTCTISSAWPLCWSWEPSPRAVPAAKGAVAPALAPAQALTVPVSQAAVPARASGTGDSVRAASPPSQAGASVCHAGFTTLPRGYLLARGSTGSLLSPEPALCSCTQFWVLLPKARGQWACDTAAAVTPCALVCVCVPPHVCTSMPMSICGSVCAHGHIPALQAIPLSTAIPAWASTGAGRVQGMEQDSGSSGQLPPWQLSRESFGESVPLSHGYSSPVHPQALGQASCSWLPPCGGCPQLCTHSRGPCLPLCAG